LLVAVLTIAPAFAQLPALRDRPLGAAERVRYTALEAQFTRISTERNTSVAAVRTIARALGERLATQSPEQLVRAIDERAQELSTARGRIAALERDLEAMDSLRLAQAVGPLLTAANAAIDAGDLSAAETRLQEAGSRFSEARANLQGRVDQLSAREADILAQRAAVRLSVFDDLGAAELLGQAAALIPASNPNRKWELLHRQGRVLFGAGSVTTDLAPLQRALTVLRDQALPLAPAGERPSQRLQTQREIAGVLSTLGARTGEAGQIEEGLRVAREIAAATPRADADAWLLAQAQLGQSLSSRGAQTRDVALLREAAALLATTSDAVLQNSSGARRPGVHVARVVALIRLANVTGEAADWRATAEVSRRVLATIDRQTQPRDWALMQGYLAGAVYYLGEKSRSVAQVQEAVALERAAMAAVPSGDLLVTQMRINLSQKLTTLGELQGAAGAPAFVEAVSLLREVATPAFRAQAADGWAFAQRNMAIALLAQGRATSDAAALEASAAAWRTLQDVQTREAHPLLWTTAQVGLARALSLTAVAAPAANRPARVEAARTAWREAQSSARTLALTELASEADTALAALDRPPQS